MIKIDAWDDTYARIWSWKGRKSNLFFISEPSQEIDAQVRKEVDEATKQAKSEAEIDVEELSADIYKNNLEPYIRGLHPGAPLQHREVAPRN